MNFYVFGDDIQTTVIDSDSHFIAVLNLNYDEFDYSRLMLQGSGDYYCTGTFCNSPLLF